MKACNGFVRFDKDEATVIASGGYELNLLNLVERQQRRILQMGSHSRRTSFPLAEGGAATDVGGGVSGSGWFCFRTGEQETVSEQIIKAKPMNPKNTLQKP
ncbi:unnamed protein product [Dovyalis caffra]|uniref:Uncharacterized protein n=1 Tax=Dovyalis caffra TaxID=77055 RepID=A0AAV1RSC4_9ROSI|nr:unnamed protein product [Dovyalis caffra]